MKKIFKKIENQISNNKVILYMKGTPEEPKCGFSAQVVKILLKNKVKFAYVDVLKDIEIRNFLPKYSKWPTFPQLWVKRKLIGGCDIVVHLDKKDQLAKIFKKNDC
ncbi:Grx4 family monothiol glutaredoxin [bacterium endosymbiont of Pedicinus badii]|uniref:Grx4 family monothiol glutaredoxin n=1 Tax=bacterium endosymbiont of Pedicinus badii TaxID=1719126 RepID=UPI0009BB9BC7|nr:Grx4 family monothiol glutaredoxin [bacterium endosymbiont of Pedicinus badii]OQM34398.1 glutaredoxin [bacterium endosymbiont of Pedicinus badii]